MYLCVALVESRLVVAPVGCFPISTFIERVPRRRYIYASHSGGGGSLGATWHARYIGHVEECWRYTPRWMKFRPFSTAHYVKDSVGKWAVFWEVGFAGNLTRRTDSI